MTTGLPILDAIESAIARDEGMQKVTDNNSDWHALALLQIEQFARNREGWANTEHGVTGEDLRHMLIPRIGHPSHPNAFGALMFSAVRRGILVATGQYRPMKDKSSHARKTAIYIFGTQK